MVYKNKWFMKKIVFIILISFGTFLLSSCMGQNKCSAYGEKQRYQRNPSSWVK